MWNSFLTGTSLPALAVDALTSTHPIQQVRDVRCALWLLCARAHTDCDNTRRYNTTVRHDHVSKGMSHARVTVH
jgi:hypothetical protein